MCFLRVSVSWNSSFFLHRLFHCLLVPVLTIRIDQTIFLSFLSSLNNVCHISFITTRLLFLWICLASPHSLSSDIFLKAPWQEHQTQLISREISGLHNTPRSLDMIFYVCLDGVWQTYRDQNKQIKDFCEEDRILQFYVASWYQFEPQIFYKHASKSKKMLQDMEHCTQLLLLKLTKGLQKGPQPELHLT